MSDPKPTAARGKGRPLARERAVQALYQREITGQTVADIHLQFLEDREMKGLDLPYFQRLIRGTDKHQDSLDSLYSPHLDRAVASLDIIERVILRLACYELVHEPSVPYRVVINEGVELAKRFGGEQGHKYVNAVLDKAAKTARAATN